MASNPVYGRRTSGTDDGAVGLLAVFHDGDEGAGDAEPGAVEGVRELRARSLFGAVPYLGAAGLEVGAVGDGADLKPVVAPRRPEFHVVGLYRREAQIAGALEEDSVMESQTAAQFLGVGDHFVQGGRGVMRLGEAEHLPAAAFSRR